MGTNLLDDFLAEEFVFVFLQILGDLESEKQGILFFRLD